MESRPPATSIFELLTAKNPELVHIEPDNKNLTSSRNYFYPKELQPWDEFNFETLEDVFAGTLLREARQNDRSLPAFPTLIPELDCVISDEKSTTSLIVKWNEAIVNMALISIRDDFHPSLWNSKTRKHEKQDAEPSPARRGKRKQPPRRSSQAHRVQKPRKNRLSALRPDSGAVYHALSPEEQGSPKTKERFPKEYKPATKWRSEKFFRSGFLNNKGKMRKGMIMQNYCMPIGQAFTYCLAHACRYGCILTCGEAFIFRVRPRAAALSKKKGGDNQQALTKSLREDGLLEYVSIPWTNHYQGDVDSYKDLTVNLAMWFVHVLAGNQYWIDWKYSPLTEEEPKVGRLSEATTEPSFESRDSEVESDSSETTAPLGYTPVSVKDGEFSVGEDAIHWSFSENDGFTK